MLGAYHDKRLAEEAEAAARDNAAGEAKRLLAEFKGGA